MDSAKERASAAIGSARASLDEALAALAALPAFDPGVVGFVAHALNNYLTVTVASLELLEQELTGRLTPESRLLLDGLGHTSSLMCHAVNSLLGNNASRPKVGCYPTRIASLSQRAIEFYRKTAEQKQLTLALQAAPDTPQVIWTDAIALAAVLDNLLSNAIKYSPPGGRVEIAISREGEEIVLSVSDQGEGLSAADRERLFQPGAKLTPQPTGGEPSHGYGLAVAKELIASLDGAIGCESAPGQGSRFWLRLPART